MNPRTYLSPLLAALVLAPSSRSEIIDFSVTAGGSGNWHNDNSWIGGSAPADDLTTDIARFNQTGYANQPGLGTTRSRAIGGIVVGDGVTATAALTIGGSTTLSLGAHGLDVKASTGATTLAVTNLLLGADQIWNTDSGNLLLVSSKIAGDHAIEKTGTGVLKLGSANTFTGGFTLTAGTVQVEGSAPSGSFGTGTVTLRGGIVSSTSGGARVVNNAVVVSGNTQIGVAGFNGSVTFAGPATIQGDRTVTLVNGGGNLSGTVTLEGNLTLDSRIGTQGTAPAGSNLTGAISDGAASRGLVKTGSGVVTLSGDNTYSGGTAIDDGYLNAGSANALGTGIVSFGGGTLDLRGQNLVVNALSGSSGSITDTAAAGTRTLTLGQGGGSGIFAGDFTQASSTKIIAVTKTGSGTQVLGGVSGYTGKTTVAEGTLQFAKQVSLYNNTGVSWTAANIQVDSGATLAFNVGGAGEFTAANINTLLGISTAADGFKDGSILGLDTTNAAGGVFTFGSVLADTHGGANSLGLAKLGSGTLVFLEPLAFTGDVFIRGGTLSFQNESVADTAGVFISSGALFDLDFFGTDTISRLYLGGQGTVAGTYGRIGSGAEFESAFFTGDGLLHVLVSTSAVPEPASFALAGGLLALAGAALRRRRRAA